MRLSIAHRLFTALLLGDLLPAISALTLSNFQPINGFDAACTNAYNTPLADCTDSDFAGQGCSTKCIGFLDSLQTTMAEDCAGTSTYRNTLIGLFLADEGVHTLCSNVPNGGSSSSGGGGGDGQSGGQAGAYGIGIQSAAGETSASTTSISTSASITSTSTSTSTTISSSTTSTSSTPQAAATSSTTTVVPTTVTPEPTTTSVAVIGTTVTPESPSDASSSTSHTKSSTSTSTSNGNGGGTPLDIGSSACHDAAVSVWLFGLLAGSAGVIWLL